MLLGICVRDLPTAEVGRLARFAEDNTFSHLFLPEATQVLPDGRPSGRSCWPGLTLALQATTTLRVGVGVAALPFWSLPHLAATGATLHELSAGRFLLGVGVSHREAALRLGVPFPDRPFSWLRERLRWLRDHPTAFAERPPLLVGALGPRSVALGAAEADGVVLNWLSPTHAEKTVQAARAAAGARSPLLVLYVRLARMESLRSDAVAYDAMANYHRHFLDQGLTDPDTVVRETCLSWDDPGAARDRLARYAAAGVDVVCLYPHGLDEAERERALRAVADTTR